MTRKTIITLGLLFAAALAPVSAIHAAAFSTPPVPVEPNAATVPADARWIIYLNIDQAMATPGAGKYLGTFLDSRPGIQQAIDHVQTVMGNEFPGDFHRIIIIGRKVGPGHGVVVMHATATQRHISQIFYLNPAVGTMMIGKTRVNIIPSSDKNGYTTFESSPTQGTFVVSHSENALKHELDVLRGKSTNMVGNNSLLAGAHNGLIFYLADTDMAQLLNRPGQHPGPAWMKSVAGGWLAARVEKEKLDIVGRFDLNNATSAAQIVQMAHGLQAMMDLSATNANANPRQRFIADLTDRLKVGAVGNTIHIHWAMSVAKLLAAQKFKPPATQQSIRDQ